MKSEIVKTNTPCTYNYFLNCLNNLKEAYIKALINEFKLKNISKYQLSTIYIGGGTPSSLSIDLLEMLFSTLNKNLKLNELLEFTFELNKRIDLEKIIEFTFEINPEDINIELLKLLKKYHVNRLSIGIQTLNKSFQQLIKREFEFEKLSTIVALVKEFGFVNYSFDLMYGFKNQVINDIKSDIDSLISLNPKHISIYSLIVEDHTIFGKLKNDGKVLESNDDEQAKEYLFIIDYLEKLGYHQYETSNFATDGYKSKHNLIYWDHDDYLCIGSGASSFIDDIRSVTTTFIHEYIQHLNNNELPHIDSELLDFEDYHFNEDVAGEDLVLDNFCHVAFFLFDHFNGDFYIEDEVSESAVFNDLADAFHDLVFVTGIRMHHIPAYSNVHIIDIAHFTCQLF